jgi:hypothetical protein
MFGKHKKLQDYGNSCPLCDQGLRDGEMRTSDLQAHYYWHQLELMKREGR